MRILDQIKNVKWIVKVYKSCETDQQRKNASRLARHWVKSNRPNVVRCSQDTWDNYIALGRYLADISQEVKQQLKTKSL